MEETKTCTKCGEAKPATGEWWNHSGDRWNPHCKSCRKAYRDANSERLAMRSKTYRDANKAMLSERRKAWRALKGEEWRKRENDRARQYQKDHAEICNAKNRAYQKAHPDKAKDWYFKTTYGITLADYNRILQAQGGVCDICKKPPAKKKGRYSNLHIDHNHDTGRVRGLLCHRCNLAIGHSEENITILKAAVAYLKR